MKWLRDFLNWLSRASMALAGVALVLMMFNVVADIAGKYLFAHPVPGTTKIVAWYYMVAVAFLPIAYVQTRREHLMVEMFTMKLPERARAFLDGLVAVGGLVYTGVLTRLVFFGAIKATSRGEFQDVSFFDLTVWPSRWVLPLAFGLLTLVLMQQAVFNFWFALTGKRLAPEPEVAKDMEAA